ncbi:MATE family efflux transporter [Anaerotignum sp. MB30-C6]|uniref:MATE family efflux transporter n=1 Tax=Anaerotignum sp. MB30-C6 TaxID=3070814 RepID=UPI0027DE3842|nr:MATE family efflux transporter [Anaerotignum sp. MB30-C6]WMI80512.1 MATE family efflux transporter [Anaerotignum sp. MB30-C6]
MSSVATEIKENKMGTMSVNKLLFTMSVPMIISMLVQALYNIVDSAFVAQISENALSAVSLAFPMQNFMIAVATGTGVGVNALLSKSLGAKKFDTANKTACVSLFLAVMNWLFFVIICLIFTKPFLIGQTNVPEIIQEGETYLRIVLIGSLGIFLQVAVERLLQSTGRTVYAMITQCVGAVVNIVLDPILIFGLFGLPKMGVAGAAYATIAGQIIGCIVGILLNIKRNHEIHIEFKNILPNKFILKSIYIVAIPSILMVSIGSIMIFCMNRILDSFTPTAIAVFGVYFKLQSFIFMPVFGLTNGMIPIIAYNYGARNKLRITQTIKMSIITAVVIMVAGFALFQLVPHKLLAMFNASENMISIGVPALRIISFSFLLAGYNIITSSVFQALGNGVYSLITSIARQLVVLMPAAYFLARLGNLNNVWLAFPIAEIMAFILCTIFIVRIVKKLNF